MQPYTILPLPVAERAIEMLEQSARQLMRVGGMLNRDLAGDCTKAASVMRAAMANETDPVIAGGV